MIAACLSARLSTLLVTTLALANPSDEYARGRTAFLRAEYRRAITTLEPLLYPELRLESQEEAVQAHRMLGVSYLFENQPDHARSEFRKLLELAPDFRFDPFLDPPRVVDFFNEVVKEQQEELGDIESRLKKREAELARRNSQVLERRIERRSFLINFVPFGAGQFQNQQRRKGWMFFGAETALAATSAAAFVANFWIYGIRPVRPCLDPAQPQGSGAAWVCPADRVDHSGEDLSRNLARAQIASGTLFFAVAVWGLVDALRNFRSEVPIGETLAGPQPPGPVSSVVSPARIIRHEPRHEPRLGIWLGPTSTPATQGAVLTLTF